MQRLALASVLVLGLLAGASALMILSHGDGQAQPQSNVLTQNSHVAPSTTTASTNSTSTTVTSTSSGLLRSESTHTGRGDD